MKGSEPSQSSLVLRVLKAGIKMLLKFLFIHFVISQVLI